ncbi:hypothetical protein E2C01_073896 [Portunus trituberculatus]|uniref:Uncharacterized protein n=1 Tax=Portunus trituberculatus TaxID=210409 RepID=A0A5B7I1Y6_PORTR|nr:hypothetical protein [Portunus trituberculatus]
MRRASDLMHVCRVSFPNSLTPLESRHASKAHAPTPARTPAPPDREVEKKQYVVLFVAIKSLENCLHPPALPVLRCRFPKPHASANAFRIDPCRRL